MIYTTPDSVKARWRTLLDGASALGYDTLVACTPENLFYMTGFWGEAIGVLDRDGPTIVSPSLEIPRIAVEAPDCSVLEAERGRDLLPAVAGLLKGKRPCADCTSYDSMTLLQKYAPAIRHQDGPFTQARLIKDARETDILARASSAIDELFEICAQRMAPGQSEVELQAILMAEAAHRDLFDTGYPFTLNPLIVAGGPNGALPHAQATSRRFQRGDLVVVDITLRYKGYVSDATRTFAVGPVRRQATEIYDTVRESQALGLAAAKSGTPCSEVDGACRASIDGAGYGDRFIHATGHGIGLEVHEAPPISQSSDIILENAMAVTIEPGIYIPGELGVRIEDSMIVGGGPLHHFTRELVRV